MNEKLIEEIMKQIDNKLSARNSKPILDMSFVDIKILLQEYISDKLIIDKKVVEDMIEKRKNIYKSNPFKENTWTTEKKIIEDLKSLQETTEQQWADVEEREVECVVWDNCPNCNSYWDFFPTQKYCSYCWAKIKRVA